MQALLKVYAQLSGVSPQRLVALRELAPEAIGMGGAADAVEFEFTPSGGYLNISFEGFYFPVEEYLEILMDKRLDAQVDILADILVNDTVLTQVATKADLRPRLDSQKNTSVIQSLEVSGKLDVIDLEKWCLTRTVFSQSGSKTSSSSLNQVLEYSGH